MIGMLLARLARHKWLTVRTDFIETTKRGDRYRTWTPGRKTAALCGWQLPQVVTEWVLKPRRSVRVPTRAARNTSTSPTTIREFSSNNFSKTSSAGWRSKIPERNTVSDVAQPRRVETAGVQQAQDGERAHE